MVASGRVWLVLLAGVLAAAFMESRTHWLEANLALTVALAAVWAALLAGILRGGQSLWLDRQLQRLHRTEELSRCSLIPVNQDEFLRRALEHVTALVRAEGAAAYVCEGEAGAVLRAATRMGLDELRGHAPVSGKDPLLSTALYSRNPSVVEPGSEVNLPPTLAHARGSAVVVPLWDGDRLLGYVVAVSRYPLALSAETREWLRILAAQLTASVHNATAYEELQRESRTDPLTRLGSRRYFDETFRRELAMARRHLRPLSLAMIDVDRMKTINDEWGHPMGDEVLKTVGELLRETRCGDVAARYGGDEFLLLMPDTTVQQAELAVQRVRERVDELNAEQRFPFTLRLSIGVRQMGGPDADLLAEADAAMYREKNERRHEDIHRPRSFGSDLFTVDEAEEHAHALKDLRRE